jgi:hypothetical protein
VGESRRRSVLRVLLLLRQPELEVCDPVLQVTDLILLALQPVTQLVDLDTLLVMSEPERLELLLSLSGDRGDLVQPAHASTAVLDANWTLNVNDGVVPVIVQPTRWYVFSPVGSARVTVAVVVWAGYVSRVVHVDPSGLSCTTTVSDGVVPNAAVIVNLDWASVPRAQPDTAEPFPVVVRAADGTTTS